MIRLHVAVVVERTVAQLPGMACLALEDVVPPKKQIVSPKRLWPDGPDLR
jgi:DNA polymerase V